LLGLTGDTLRELSTNPVLKGEGFGISSRLNLRRMLEAAPNLSPPEPPDWSRFPGCDGFTEQSVLADRDIILDTMHADPALPSAAEINSLNVRWAEIGIFLVKS
jgi:hypothetical protein